MNTTTKVYRNVRDQLVIETRTTYPVEGRTLVTRTLVTHKVLTAQEEGALVAYVSA